MKNLILQTMKYYGKAWGLMAKFIYDKVNEKNNKKLKMLPEGKIKEKENDFKERLKVDNEVLEKSSKINNMQKENIKNRENSLER